ncbi:hypothetical protein J3R83DRAFT_2840 [Lanmaoa asiatica]|nr:hypothetical protein J3R83DRAFT_2840 [Lanmaoa asiatica]
MSRSPSQSTRPPPSARIRIANDTLIERDPRDGPIPSSLSLLSARRPSWAPPLYDPTQDSISAGIASYRDVPALNFTASASQRSQPSTSPDDGGNFRRSLQIDMKDLVGDAVGNMSISPTSRDIVLAARRGLFIIDLEAPLEIPRFLPQGGTWDVADVQWNPHRARAEYIVSTSSEKLLIWNLMIVGKSSIEHILHSHYRAITDINWHTSEPDIVSSVGIDSWLWSWDLREPRKPIMGKEQLPSGGTQVKWNRQDPNVLASSHMDEVLIWDRRKGSLPTARIRAHSGKIYGIDWAHTRMHDIVTCSLDKTIKVWNVQDTSAPDFSQTEPFFQKGSKQLAQPLAMITTRYPVWRARDLPFGRGILSLPQRGETALEMWATGNDMVPVEVFEGHTDVVKEFVWRKGGLEGSEYQLITWSKDRTLRFWPVDSETMEASKTGYTLGSSKVSAQSRFFTDFGRSHQSFRHAPEGSNSVPALSAPVGSRSILAEVRAGPAPTPGVKKPANPVLQPHHGSAARGKGILLFDSGPSTVQHQIHLRYPQVISENFQPRIRDDQGENQSQTQSRLQPDKRAVPIPSTTMTMSRGHAGGGKGTRVGMDAFTWLASVRVGGRRDESSGRDSGVSSGSRSRASHGRDGETTTGQGHTRKRSESRLREGKEVEGVQSLPDEITSVLTKLSTSKIRLEKHDLTKKRTCTLGLHGPWGESSSVFIRISFRFPKSYPHAPHPDGTPEIDLERSPLISMQNRAFMLRRLKTIRERRRPCLEACLRFLLYGDENEQVGIPVDMRSESSSDEDEVPATRKSRDFTVSLLRNNKNLAEPRTSQGVFGPNGNTFIYTLYKAYSRNASLTEELICFFRAPPRIVRPHQISGEDQLSSSPVAAPRSPHSSRLFQSPALLSDAVRRLGLAATDQRAEVDSRRPGDSEHTLRIMTNLLTFSQQRARWDFTFETQDNPVTNDQGSNVSMIPTRRSTVFIRRSTIFRLHGERLLRRISFKQVQWKICVGAMRTSPGNMGNLHMRECLEHSRAYSLLTRRHRTSLELLLTELLIKCWHREFCAAHDVQMLAMLAVVLLKAYASSVQQLSTHTPSSKEASPTVSKNECDYFSISKSNDPRAAVLSPAWPRLPSTSPTSANYVVGPSLSTSNSSRASWSSLFNTGSVRQFMSGVHESISTPLDTLPGKITVPIPQRETILRLPNIDSPRHLRRRDQISNVSPISKSWSETQMVSPLNRQPPLSSASYGRRTERSQANAKQTIQEKKLVVLEEEPQQHAQGYGSTLHNISSGSRNVPAERS